MNQTELHIYDLDGTLYRSPKPPKPDSAWWFHAHSLGKPGQPGYDGRWFLRTVARARHSTLDPCALTVVLTGRPDHPPMQKAVRGLLRLSGLHFDAIRLQPILFPGTTAQYKGLEVSRWLKDLPSVRRVVLYDDEMNNHIAVAAAARKRGVAFKGVRTPGM